jgi:uncharacterized protein (DUF302 family)
MKYHFSKIIKGQNFDKAIDQVTAKLEQEGFGILTEIDVKETLKKKIDVDFNQYKILGACHPEYAYKALKNNNKIGVFLPCNVIVEKGENGDIEVSAVDPVASMMAIENEELGCIANEIRAKLERVIKSLK